MRTLTPPFDDIFTDDTKKYQLALMEDWTCVIISRNNEVFHAGRDKHKAARLELMLNKTHRPNVEERDGNLYVCWNNHEKHDACEWELCIKDCNTHLTKTT